MTIPEQIYQAAINKGFTVEAACGLLANIQAESAFRADNAEDRINGTVSDAEYIRRADADLMTYNGKNFKLVWKEGKIYGSKSLRVLQFCPEIILFVGGKPSTSASPSPCFNLLILRQFMFVLTGLEFRIL